ncbi:MAG: Gfo/Idh/MocA family oxidoreductase, partial [Anaerolineae bacterium]|nr:Gfo/Idh/MocA family oxidoreductase [Anaerolineae bacterium]
MADIIRWGILGTGNIAHKFATGLQSASGAQLVAVGSRSPESADKFAREFNVPRCHASYEALAQDAEVDAIYISTPHPYHAPNSKLCLENGKAVLCEKPFAMNAHEADEMIALARQKRVFLMEAMWTRFLPTLIRTRDLIAEGAIGEVRMVTADFGFRTNFNPQGRLFAPELGGGALLDVGIYPISLAFMLFGAPSEVSSQASLGETGVDEQSAYLFGYDKGQIALLSSATRTPTPQEAFILGTEGSIKLHSPWWNATELSLIRGGKPTEVIEPPRLGNGYNYEAEEVGRCLRAGQLESDTIPLDETRTI